MRHIIVLCILIGAAALLGHATRQRYTLPSPTPHGSQRAAPSPAADRRVLDPSATPTSRGGSGDDPMLRRPPRIPEGPLGPGRDPLDRNDGVIDPGTTVFDDEVPGVANLDPALVDALRDAATDAAQDGIDLVVNSGWRSPEYQRSLLRRAIAQHGSEEEAVRWVATPATSVHVRGEAVDIGPAPAAAWLAEHGARHGLCRVYRNEPWHFELRPRARKGGCPSMYADPTHDPRMRERVAAVDGRPGR